uniref:Uncharacterized protein n=1 Tax=Trypanosoma congolense (strain IL3000) TaxID=1068625 RepID=G0UU78_TRYCI|nr:conserved hypothetical protein [Trypanosoma congolense IL3000]
MLRCFRSTSVGGGVRSISIGGRTTRGGFRQPLGKHPQVKQGIVEGIPRRIPGTTKVTFTNKKGRTFNFAVPVAEITHPQVTLKSAAGSWRSIDTSFCEIGDVEDDMPSPLDEYLREDGSGVERAREIGEKFASFCKEYVLMDTTGMKNTVSLTELNVGPDYEHYDRRLKRKRHWLAIRHRFEDVRNIIWPEAVENGAGGAEEGKNGEPLGGSSLTAEEMLDILLWLDSASTFCVRKVHPSDTAGEDEFLPLDLQREVRVVAFHARRDSNFFSSSTGALERFTSCAALCRNHKVPFSLFFAIQHTGTVADLNSGRFIISNVPPPRTVLAAVRVMSVLNESDSGNVGKTHSFSDESGVVTQHDILQGLSRLINVEAFGEKDALGNVGENELCIIVRFCVAVKEQNANFLKRCAKESKSMDRDEACFYTRFQQVSQAVLSRCKQLLYHPNNPHTQVMSEDGYIPLIELQRHAEGTNKAALIHYNLGIRSAQGLRRVALGAQSSALLAGLVERLGEVNTFLSGNTLVVDLVHHLSHKAAAGKMSLTLKEVNILLPLLARMRRESPRGVLDARFDRLLAIIEGTIGAAMQQNRTLEELVDLVEGLAACGVVPSTLKQVEMVLLRLVTSRQFALGQTKRILEAMLVLSKSGVSQVLLHSAASGVADHIKEMIERCGERANGPRGRDEEAELLVELLTTLGQCGYDALPGLVVLSWEAQLVDGMRLSPEGRCGYGLLLASAAIAMTDKYVSEGLVEESTRLLVDYARATHEKNTRCFARCIFGLTMLRSIKETRHTDVQYGAMKAYISATRLQAGSCGTLRTEELTRLLEGTLEWCAELCLSDTTVVSALEEALRIRLCGAIGRAGSESIPEDIAAAACCLVGLNSASLELRKMAACVLAHAIIHAEEALENLRLGAQRGPHLTQSFEITALTLAEKENYYKNSILVQCAALQNSDMSATVEEIWSQRGGKSAQSSHITI